MSNEVNDASRAGKVCETFRANPANRKWAGSYTENVWSRLGMVKVFKPLTPEDVAALVEARDLLWDYHHTQHKIYEQRDAARAVYEKLGEELRTVKEVGRKAAAAKTQTMTLMLADITRLARRLRVIEHAVNSTRRGF